jgi:hypothetical protein
MEGGQCKSIEHLDLGFLYNEKVKRRRVYIYSKKNEISYLLPNIRPEEVERVAQAAKITIE